MVWYWTLTEDNVQRMQVPLFIQRMQVTVLRRWRGDGMICHVPKNSQLQKNNVQGSKMPCRNIKACHLQLWLHKTKRSLL